MAKIVERFKSAMSVFADPSLLRSRNRGYYTTESRPYASRRYFQNEKSVLTIIYNQIAVDCSTVDINHVRLDDDGNFLEIIDDSLNDVFSFSANLDQTGRSFLRDVVMTMLDEGVVALIPTMYDGELKGGGESFRVYESRVGRIVGWKPRTINVEIYNDIKGVRQTIEVPKSKVPIVENPFYHIMNEPNSTLKKLIRTEGWLDSENDRNSAEKMDLIIQLPYSLKSDRQKEDAERRRKTIEAQLTGSQYGIAYIDGTERVIQLNRSVENNLWNQAKDLKDELYNQTGLNKAVFDGTANEETILNYNNRTIEPIMSAITEEIKRKWLSRTAISQKQSIRYFSDPFRLVPVSQIAEIADKFTRNCIMTSNELRSVIRLKPSKDPNADKLINSNLNQPEPNKTETIRKEDINVDL